AHGCAVRTPDAGHGTFARREHHAGAPLDRQGVPPRLCSRTLFDEKQLAARVLDVATAEHEDGLQRKRDLAVNVLMQAVVSALGVTQEQGRRSALPATVALA